MEELWKDNNIFYNILCFIITENEKLFDRSDSVLYWRTVFHMLAISHHAYISIFATSLDIESHPNPDITILYTLRGAYLTGWNFLFQTAFLGLSIFHDILEWLDKQESTLARRIKYWRDVIFCGLVVPFTLFVTSMFWCVYAIDRELVFPKVYDEVVPWWFNHCVHTNITVMIVIETFLQARRNATNRRLELILYWTVAFAYAIVYYSIYFITKKWLYQVFGIMTWWQVCLYQLLIWVGSYVFYEIQFPINRLFHKEKKAVRKHKDSNTKVVTEENNFSKSWSMKFGNVSRNENSRL